jgi:hypothetical protein
MNLRTCSRCQRRSVCGVIMNDAHRTRGRNWLVEASSIRSRGLSFSRPVLRRSTLS